MADSSLLMDEDIDAEADIVFRILRRGCFFQIPTLVVDRLVCGKSTSALQQRCREIDTRRVVEMRRDDPCDRTRSTAEVDGILVPSSKPMGGIGNDPLGVALRNLQDLVVKLA